MRRIDQFRHRIRCLFRGERADQELGDELSYHLERQIQENLAAGMEPIAARHAAMREFGGIEQFKEECRDMRRVNLIENFLRDIRYAGRTLLQNPGFTLVVVAALALGIGANTAIFSVVNAVLLRPLPYPQPDRLMQIWNTGTPGETSEWVSYPDYLDIRRQQKSFEELALYRFWLFSLTSGAEPQSLMGAYVSPSLFQVLKVQPSLGRAFARDEDQAGRNQVVLLSHARWQKSFQSDPHIVGQTVRMNGKPLTVIGVMPAGFNFPRVSPDISTAVTATSIDVWLPFSDEQKSQDRGSRNFSVVGRLRESVTLAQARSDLGGIGQHLAEQFPAADRGTTITAAGINEHLSKSIRPALLVLLAAIGLVLLIACANVANLLLARATARQRETAIRAALGASRGRLVRQLLTESVLQALLGGVAGLALSFWTTSLLLRISPQVPRMDETSVDVRVLAFTFGLSILTGLIFGLAPAYSASRAELTDALKRTASNRRTGPLGLLVAVEMALAVILLSGAGLMIRSFVNLMHVDLGFNPERVLTTWVMLPPLRYATPASQERFFTQAVQRLESMPGVAAASAVNALPLSGNSDDTTILLPGSERRFGVDWRIVTPGYFRTMEIGLTEGRLLGDTDRDGSSLVCLVSESVARILWPTGEAIGKRLSADSATGDVSGRWREVVGVVKDVRHYGLDADQHPTIYVPAAQAPTIFMILAVRSKGDPAGLGDALRSEVAAVDPEQPVFNTARMEELVASSIARRRFQMIVLATFAGFALLLGSMGIYGVTAYAVNRRTREIGIRMALGAGAGEVVATITWQGMGWALAGLAFGLVAALTASRLMVTQLFGVKPWDPMVFGATGILLGLVALAANYLPARRATKIDPTTALRWE